MANQPNSAEPTGRAHTVPGPVAAMFGWLVPGGGYWLLGERVRGVIVGVAVVVVFVMGMLIGGVRVVDAPTELGIGPLLEKPWFMGQVLIGPIGVAAAIAANHVDAPDTNYTMEHVSHSRSWEIGTLYTAVAGMLNLLVIIDAAHRTGPADEQRGDAAASGHEQKAGA